MLDSACFSVEASLLSQAHLHPHREHVVLGMVSALAAFFMFTLMNLCAKLLAETHSVIEIAFWRNLVATLPFLFTALVLGQRDIFVVREKPGLVTFRAVLGAVTIAINFAAFALMPMADTQALLFTASLFLPVLGIILLGEHVGPYRWSAVIIGLGGVLIMTLPMGGGMHLLGVSVALLAAFLQAALQTILRYLGRFERPKTVTFYFFAIGTVVTVLPLPFVWVTPSFREIPLIVGVGFAGAAGQFLFSTAFRNAPAAVVGVFNYTTIVWATLFGWLIWSDWPLPNVFVGAAIVIAANLFMIWRETVLHRRRRRAETTGPAL